MQYLPAVNDLVSHWWGLLIVAAVAIVWASRNWSRAKQVALSFIFLAEERAEELALNTGQDKFEWAVTYSYPYLPGAVRAFVSFPMYRTILQALFDQAKKWAQAHRNVSQTPLQP